MSSLHRLVFSDGTLTRHGQSWPGVPIILVDGLVALEASEWVLDLRIRGSSEHTVLSYATSLLIWLKSLHLNGTDWRSAKKSTAEQFMAALAREGCSPGTIRLRMVHIQEFYRWTRENEYINGIPFRIQNPGSPRGGKGSDSPSTPAPAVRLPRKTNRSVKPQTKEDFDKVLANTPRKITALIARDELIAEAARYIGLRRSEVAALRVDQFSGLNPSEEVQVIKISSAKSGGRIDSVLVPRLFVKKMQDFIAVHRQSIVDKIQGFDPDYTAPPEIFLNERGKNRGKPITPDFIAESWRRASKAAHIDSRFHDNRSSFATNAAKAARESGENARVVVKELLRHQNESTSEIYVAFDEIQSEQLLRARIVNDAYFKKDKK